MTIAHQMASEIRIVRFAPMKRATLSKAMAPTKAEIYAIRKITIRNAWFKLASRSACVKSSCDRKTDD